MLAEADIAPHSPFQLTVADFELLADANAFGDNRRVELIEGEIIVMAPLHMPHAMAQAEFHIRLAIKLGQVRPDLGTALTPSVSLPPHNMPMPDIAVVPRKHGRSGPAAREDALLLVEVSHSTARFDLNVKTGIYARAEVPEYWVVDLKKGQLHQHWSPVGGMYEQCRLVSIGQPIASETIEGLTIDTGGLG